MNIPRQVGIKKNWQRLNDGKWLRRYSDGRFRAFREFQCETCGGIYVLPREYSPSDKRNPRFRFCSTPCAKRAGIQLPAMGVYKYRIISKPKKCTLPALWELIPSVRPRGRPIGSHGTGHPANWNGGRIKHRGQMYLAAPQHPRSGKWGYVAEHVLIAEKMLGRYLIDGECVHHINRIKDDNRPENLQVMTTAEHLQLHRPKKVDSLNPLTLEAPVEAS